MGRKSRASRDVCATTSYTNYTYRGKNTCAVTATVLTHTPRYTTVTLLKIVARVAVLFISDPRVDRIEHRRAWLCGGASRSEFAWIVAPAIVEVPVPLLRGEE